MTELRDPVLLLPLLLLLLRAHGTPRAARLEVCTDETCFFLFPEAPLNFTGARDACGAQGGRLATLPSSDEQRAVRSLLRRSSSSGRFWIGLALPADGRCPARDSDAYGYEWITGGGGGPGVSGWARAPDRCDHRCASVSTNGSWEQQPCGATLDGFLCAALSGWCLGGERLAEPGVHAVSIGSTHARWIPPSAAWTTRRGEDARDFESKWLCAWNIWHRAPWTCEVLNGGCAHTCQNNTCTCPAGQVLHANVTCVDDADECRDGYEREDGACVDVSVCQRCEHMRCPKVAGVYACACRDGFVVSAEDPTRCDAHCDLHECPATCVDDPDRPGRYQCRCPAGYIHDVSANNESLCVELDECETETPCDHVCVNTRGSYTCSCRAGFVMYDEECVADVDYDPDPDPAAAATPELDQLSSSSQLPAAGGVPSYVRVGAALGIAVFVGACAALLYLLLRHALARCRATFEVTSLRRADLDIVTLQQVTTEKYQRFSFDKQSTRS